MSFDVHLGCRDNCKTDYDCPIRTKCCPAGNCDKNCILPVNDLPVSTQHLIPIQPIISESTLYVDNKNMIV